MFERPVYIQQVCLVNFSGQLELRFYLKCSELYDLFDKSYQTEFIYNDLEGVWEPLIWLKACSHEPGAVKYLGLIIALAQALPSVYMIICCSGAILPKASSSSSDH